MSTTYSRSGSSAARGTRYGAWLSRSLRLAADDPLRERRFGQEEGTGDLGRVEAAEEPQGERDLGVRRE